MDLIYLDHAATTPLDKEVMNEALPYFLENYGNADSPHALGRKAMGAVDEARDTVAALLSARKNEVYFTSGGTEADNWAVLGGAWAKRREGRTKILLSAVEHHAVLSCGERLAKEGFTVEYIPVNAGGRVELSALENAIDDDTALVGLMSVNNETGVLQPVREASEIAHAHGALFFTDAVQSAPHIPIRVDELGADMLSFSAHKFYGPKGVGVLYIKNGVKVDKLVAGGEQERGMRGGTVNVPLVVALAKAYEKCRRDMQATNEKLRALSTLFLREISVLDGVHRNGENALPCLLNLRFEGVTNTSFLYNMDLQGVCLAAGSACASASVKPSHVLTAMGLTDEQAKECVRISLGKDNTEAEIHRAAQLTVETVNRLRNM